MLNRRQLLPLPLPLLPLEEGAVPRPVGKREDEHAVPQALAPRALEEVAVGVPDQPLAALLAVHPVALVHGAVGEEVLAEAAPLVGGELAEVLVAGVGADRPPELSEALLAAVEVVALVAVAVGEEVDAVARPAALVPVAGVPVKNECILTF